MRLGLPCPVAARVLSDFAPMPINDTCAAPQQIVRLDRLVQMYQICFQNGTGHLITGRSAVQERRVAYRDTVDTKYR